MSFATLLRPTEKSVKVVTASIRGRWQILSSLINFTSVFLKANTWENLLSCSKGLNRSSVWIFA